MDGPWWRFGHTEPSEPGPGLRSPDPSWGEGGSGLKDHFTGRKPVKVQLFILQSVVHRAGTVPLSASSVRAAPEDAPVHGP